MTKAVEYVKIVCSFYTLALWPGVRQCGILNLRLLELFCYYSAPVGVRSICDHPVCLCVSVCSPVYLLNRWTDLYELLSAGHLWPLLSLQPAALCYVVYFRFYG